jgi:hypothetical protein
MDACTGVHDRGAASAELGARLEVVFRPKLANISPIRMCRQGIGTRRRPNQVSWTRSIGSGDYSRVAFPRLLVFSLDFRCMTEEGNQGP